MKSILFHLVTIFLFLQPSFAQNFSCSFGKQAACLDYDDKVCSSFSKCVDQNALCFDQYQCNYDGFTCKSNVTDIATKHDDLVTKYNNLLDEYQNLVIEKKPAS